MMTSHESKLYGKKIIIILGSLELGGAERQALILALYLIKHGANVEFWGFSNLGKMADLCDENGICWRICPYPWSSRSIIRTIKLLVFARALKKEKPDLILPYTMAPNVICGLIWRHTGAKLCVWNQRDEGRGRFGRKYEQQAVRNISCFISNSYHGKDFLVDELKIKPDKIQVIKNGVELKFKIASEYINRDKWRNHLGLSENCFVACMIANLTEFKDHDTLLKAWRIVCDQLNERKINGVLLLAGRFDNTHKPLKILADDLDLNDNIRFLGKVNNVQHLLNVVDLGVFSSQHEGCPNGVLECMEAGLPVVGTDIPGIREALGSNGYPFLAPIKNPTKFAELIIKFCFDPELRAKCGALNRHRIETEFNPEDMCEKTLELLIKNLATAY
jgi:glycosyltransferase involved in cell wall biosynthesis